MFMFQFCMETVDWYIFHKIYSEVSKQLLIGGVYNIIIKAGTAVFYSLLFLCLLIIIYHHSEIFCFFAG